MDPNFHADAENPAISLRSGFDLCGDPRCRDDPWIAMAWTDHTKKRTSFQFDGDLLDSGSGGILPLIASLA